MSNSRLVRSLIIGAASLACFTTALSARAALPGYGGYSVWATGAVTQRVLLPLSGTAADTTCFLSGISGSLAAESWVGLSSDAGPDGGWVLDVAPSGSGAELAGKATCLNVPFASATLYIQNSTGSQTLVPAAGGTQCFLFGVDSFDGDFYSGATATVTVQGGNWVLSVSGVHGVGQASASAVCLPAPNAYQYLWNHWTGTKVISNPGGTPTWQDNASDPVACGLRGISGQFQGNASDGVDMNWPSWGGYWNMTATNGKYGWLTCLE